MASNHDAVVCIQLSAEGEQDLLFLNQRQSIFCKFLNHISPSWSTGQPQFSVGVQLNSSAAWQVRAGDQGDAGLKPSSKLPGC